MIRTAIEELDVDQDIKDFMLTTGYYIPYWGDPSGHTLYMNAEAYDDPIAYCKQWQAVRDLPIINGKLQA